MAVNFPPTSRWLPPVRKSVSTWPLAECAQSWTMVLLYVLIYAILCAEEPPACEKFPPIQAWRQSPVHLNEVSVPLTLGAHDVIVYGAACLKLKMLCRVNVWPPWLIEVKVPTAYMTPLQATSCLICSVVPVVASAGVPVAG